MTEVNTRSVRLQIISSDKSHAFGFYFTHKNGVAYLDCAVYGFLTKEKIDCVEKVSRFSRHATLNATSCCVTYTSKNCSLEFTDGESVGLSCEYKKAFFHTDMACKLQIKKSEALVNGGTLLSYSVAGEVNSRGRRYCFSDGDMVILSVINDGEGFPSIVVASRDELICDNILVGGGGKIDLGEPALATEKAGYAYKTVISYHNGKTLEFTPIFNDRDITVKQKENGNGDRFFGVFGESVGVLEVHKQ